MHAESAQGMECSERGRWGEGSRRGHRPRQPPRTGSPSRHPAGNPTPLHDRGQRQVSRPRLDIKTIEVACCRALRATCRDAAFARLGSLRRPPIHGSQRIGPVQRVRKRAVSAGRHVGKDQEQQGPRGCMQRVLKAWSAASEGDGARVRDAATDLDSRREQVVHRDTQRGIQPRCMTEVRGKSADPG